MASAKVDGLTLSVAVTATRDLSTEVSGADWGLLLQSETRERRYLLPFLSMR